MAVLLGDVGGTNARLAIARNGSIDPTTVTRFRGDDFACFDDVVRQFMAEQHQPHVSALCIAVAGPVSGGQARLTNRDWSFDGIFGHFDRAANSAAIRSITRSVPAVTVCACSPTATSPR